MLIFQQLSGDEDFKTIRLASQVGKSHQVFSKFDEHIPHEGFFIGSIEGCEWMAVNRPQVKQCATFAHYDCSYYYPQIQELLFNDDHIFLPFKDLKRKKWQIYGWFGKESKIFIRPNSSKKEAAAEVVDIQEIDAFVDEFDYHGLAVVSSPKGCFGEWRFVVSEGQIIAVSSYRYQQVRTCVPSAPLGATALVQKVLDKGINPDKIFCVDVVQDTGGEFWVIELTSFSSAGLYACDIHKIAELLKQQWTS
jgi:hypothetical protein